jgi:hypothetical protein
MLDPRRELPITESSARSLRLTRLALACAVTLLALAPPPARAGEALVPPEEVKRTLVVQNLAVQDGRVAGVLVNQAGHAVRDVRLQVVFSWLWADEHRQGDNDPSFVATEVIPDLIPPGGSVTFGYSYPSAATQRRDGQFIVEARVIGFTAVAQAPGR